MARGPDRNLGTFPGRHPDPRLVEAGIMGCGDDEGEDPSNESRAVMCRYCGARYILTGPGDFVCQVCDTPLTKDNTDPAFIPYDDQVDDDY